MNNTNWDEFRCRCSGIHKIMANSRSNPQISARQVETLAKYNIKLDDGGTLTATQLEEYKELKARYANKDKIVLSDTCIQYLMEVYAWETQRMISVLHEMSEITQLEKGKMVEEDCITLLSIVEGQIYVKNDERVQNDYLSGEPDVFTGESVMSAESITDIKAAFDYPGFLKKINQELTNGWYQQVQGYCDITGAKKGRISHCLVSMPIVMQENIYRQLKYKMANSGEYISTESPQFIKDLERIWEGLQRSMNFDHIPPQQRVFNIKVDPFTEFERNAVYDRVKVCREWLSNFDEQYKKLNLEVGNESVTFESN